MAVEICLVPCTWCVGAESTDWRTYHMCSWRWSCVASTSIYESYKPRHIQSGRQLTRYTVTVFQLAFEHGMVPCLIFGCHAQLWRTSCAMPEFRHYLVDWWFMVLERWILFLYTWSRFSHRTVWDCKATVKEESCIRNLFFRCFRQNGILTNLNSWHFFVLVQYLGLWVWWTFFVTNCLLVDFDEIFQWQNFFFYSTVRRMNRNLLECMWFVEMLSNKPKRIELLKAGKGLLSMMTF